MRADFWIVHVPCVGGLGESEQGTGREWEAWVGKCLEWMLSRAT